MTQLMELRSTKVNYGITKMFSNVLFSVSEGDWRFKDTDRTLKPLSSGWIMQPHSHPTSIRVLPHSQGLEHTCPQILSSNSLTACLSPLRNKCNPILSASFHQEFGPALRLVWDTCLPQVKIF